MKNNSLISKNVFILPEGNPIKLVEYMIIRDDRQSKYYTILKHLFMSPATKIDDIDRLYKVLDVTRKSIQRDLVFSLKDSKTHLSSIKLVQQPVILHPFILILF